MPTLRREKKSETITVEPQTEAASKAEPHARRLPALLHD
jgi:hypothetical protein